MTEDIFSKLDNVFDKHDARKKAAALAAEERKNAIEIRFEKFKEKREAIFRPAMEEVGAYLKSKGHSFRIDTDENDGKYDQDRRGDPFIRFSVVPNGYSSHQGSNNHLPHFTIRASGVSDEVYFAKSTLLGRGGGVSGGDGSAALEAVDADIVKQRLANLITEVFSR